MKPKICVSILPKTVTEAQDLIKKAEDDRADLIEVRLDLLKESNALSTLTSHSKTPLIATNRNKATAQIDRAQMLLQVAKTGFEYVDLDIHDTNIKENIKELQNLGAKPIISFHNKNGPMALIELEKILKQEIENGAEVCKIVTTAQTFKDNLIMLDFVEKASLKAKIVCFAMGDKGKISRLLSPVFGAYFTFAHLDGTSETAPGQMTIQQMRAAYGLLGITT